MLLVSLYFSKYIVQNTTNNFQYKGHIFIDYLPLRINYFGYLDHYLWIPKVIQCGIVIIIKYCCCCCCNDIVYYLVNKHSRKSYGACIQTVFLRWIRLCYPYGRYIAS
jgi:hypothetical protein